jgi:hypothetical protein
MSWPECCKAEYGIWSGLSISRWRIHILSSLGGATTSWRLLAVQPRIDVSWRRSHVSTSFGGTATFRHFSALAIKDSLI